MPAAIHPRPPWSGPSRIALAPPGTTGPSSPRPVTTTHSPHPATTHPCPEQTAAVYLPRLVVTSFGAGVRRTFLYELVDGKPDPGLEDPQQHFGLLRNDLSPKPAFTALQTLIRALRSSPRKPASKLPSWVVASRRSEAEAPHTDQARRVDDHRALATGFRVGRECTRPVDPAPLTVELSLGGREGRDVEVWRPSTSTRPVERHERVSRLTLALEGEVVLVSLR